MLLGAAAVLVGGAGRRLGSFAREWFIAVETELARMGQWIGMMSQKECAVPSRRWGLGLGRIKTKKARCSRWLFPAKHTDGPQEPPRVTSLGAPPQLQAARFQQVPVLAVVSAVSSHTQIRD